MAELRHAVCRLTVAACLISLLVIARAEEVIVADGEGLKGYLCSPTGTIPPNTSLVLSVSTLDLPVIQGNFCRIENTTNIIIASSDEVVNEHKYVTVKCKGNTGFLFFNVTNLNIRSVYFKNCNFTVPASSLYNNYYILILCPGL